MSTNRLPYVYDPQILAGKQIRVFKFRPYHDNESTPRKCVHLEDVNVINLPSDDNGSRSNAKPYIAMSYVWGESDENNPEILINERPFKVTPNLQKLLVHLEDRLRLEHRIDLPIWIDAICINQGETKDRNHQVNQMRDIYRYAAETIIWLGEGNDSVGRVMTHLDRIGKDAIAAKLNDLTLDDMKKWPDFQPDSDKAHIRKELEHLIPRMSKGYEDQIPFPLQDMIKLSELKWFTRVWVIQELSVSNDYNFMYGKWIVPGDHFVAAFKFSVIWTMSDTEVLQKGLHGERISVNARASSTLGTRRKWKEECKTITLKNLLVHSFIRFSAEGLGATNPRDKIYALLGLASNVEELEITPNYNKSIVDLYKEVARKLIQKGHLDILSLCKAPFSGEVRDINLPSWAPDWRRRILPPWGGFLEENLVYASGENQGKWIETIPTASDNILAIKARFVGKLKEFGTVWTFGENGKFDKDKAKTLFREVAGFLLKTKIYNGPLIGDAIWQIPIGDKEMSAFGVTQRATTEIAHKQFKHVWTRLWSEESLVADLDTLSYLECMEDMYNGKPFLSEDAFGGYVGLCPSNSHPGDEIFIPFGSHVPLMFRNDGNGYYKVIGEIYMHGLMYGEALELNLECREIQLI